MSKQQSKLAINLYNREYIVNCDPGQEDRLRQLIAMVQEETKHVDARVGNATEPRLLMLTCLSLADKLLEAGNQAEGALTKQEDLFVAAVSHLKERVTMLASQIGRA